jgi:hypothetical protein
MAQEKKIDLSRFREKFVAEARTRLSRMNEGLVARLEKGRAAPASRRRSSSRRTP